MFLGSAGNLTGYNAAAKTLAGQAAVFDLDGTGDVSVKLNARLNSGSGSGDMFLLMPELGRSPARTANSFVYLYSKFGGLAGASATAASRSGPCRRRRVAAPAGTGSLSGRVFLDRDRNGLLRH